MSETLIRRLRELSHAITEGKEARDREFTMRIPAEPERDADLVLSTAADRIAKLEAKIAMLHGEHCSVYLEGNSTVPACVWRERRIAELERDNERLLGLIDDSAKAVRVLKTMCEAIGLMGGVESAVRLLAAFDQAREKGK